MNANADLIPCAKGWQAEIGLGAGWTTYSRVYRTREKCIEKAEAHAKRLGVCLVWSPAEEPEMECVA